MVQNGVVGSVPGHILLQTALGLIPQRCSKAPETPWVTTGPYLLSFTLAELQRDYSANRVITILPHSTLFANFWHNTRKAGLDSIGNVYKAATYCALETNSLTFQLGLSTNLRNADYTEKDGMAGAGVQDFNYMFPNPQGNHQ